MMLQRSMPEAVDRPAPPPELIAGASVHNGMDFLKTDDQGSPADSEPSADEKTASDRTDRGLIRQIAESRDAAAMKTFYEHYRPRLLPFFYRLTRDHQLVEDVFNEVMLKIWDSAHQYRGQSKVSTWVFTIAYRACLRLVKQQKRSWQLFDSRDNLDEFHDENSSHPSGQAAIRAAVQRLKAEHRMVIELCYFQGYALEDISQIINCPLNTVKTRLHHARKKMRAVLEKQLGAGEWSDYL